jgi:uncharacterized protein YjiS (DUF1127 family)
MSTNIIANHIEIDFGRAWNSLCCAITFRAPIVGQFCSISAFQRKMAQWQAISEFKSLDNEYLEDIGIERYEIKDFVLHGKL